MKCRHDDRVRTPRVVTLFGDAESTQMRLATGNCGTSVVVLTRVCASCGEWLSLGPANDADERVAIEIRAAELAQRITDGVVDILPLRLQGWNTDEQHGFYDYRARGDAGDCSCRDSKTALVDRNWHSAYLAAAIAAHEEAE